MGRPGPAPVGPAGDRFRFLGAHDPARLCDQEFRLKSRPHLILVTFTLGYALGFIGALAWKKLHESK